MDCVMKGLNKITCCLLAALLMPCAGHAENEQYGANFNNADIRQFVEIVGQHLGKTILIDPSVQEPFPYAVMIRLANRSTTSSFKYS